MLLSSHLLYTSIYFSITHTSRRLVPLSQLQVAKEIHYPFPSLAGRLLSPCTHTHSPNPSCFHSPEVGGDSMLCFTEKLKPFPEHALSRVTSSLELNSDCTMISRHSGVKVLHVNPSCNRDQTPPAPAGSLLREDTARNFSNTSSGNTSSTKIQPRL